jgi:RNA exonuclease NGL2
MAGPGMVMLAVETVLPTTRANGVFTVMSYNLLAQCLARRPFYPYTSKTALKLAPRHQLLREEIRRLNPTVACLQEVDNLHLWRTLFREMDYTYLHYQHPLKKHGCCIIYKNEVFERVAYEEVDLDDDVEMGAATGPTKTVAQVAVLRCKEHEADGLVISNHHLFFPPTANYEKLRQTCTVLSRAVALGQKYAWPILVCGGGLRDGMGWVVLERMAK